MSKRRLATILVVMLAALIVLASCERGSSPPRSSQSQDFKLRFGEDLENEIMNPTDVQIREFIVEIETDLESGVLLKRSGSRDFIHAAHDGSNRFFMEYQDATGSYISENRAFLTDEVVRAFKEYREGVIKWSDYGAWVQL